MQTVCLHPHPLLLRVPRLCAPPWRPPSSPRTLSGGALFPPPFTRGVCATPPLCANGECRAARKGTPPRYAPLPWPRLAEQEGERSDRRLLCPSLPVRTGWGEGGAPIRAWTGRGAQTEEIGRGCEDRCGVAGTLSLRLRAGVPRKSSARAAPPFTLLPYPMRLNGAAHNPRAAREAGALKGSGAPPPLRVSTTPRAVPRARPLHAPPSGARRALSRMRDGVCRVASEGGACRGRARGTTRGVVLTPPSLQR